MFDFSQTLIYIFLFIALYFEVFILITYLENRTVLKQENEALATRPLYYPTACIIVPCWNEAGTVAKTTTSLLAMDYPTDKLEIILVDDGSTDNTWSVMQQFANHPQVKIFRKENGGKHTALNFGLSQSTSEIVGCLDADSFVAPDALTNIVLAFQSDPEIMAVTPSVKISEPKSVIQIIQSVEYVWAIFLRKMLSYIDAIYVTPGPFSIFKREVFAQIGEYREAHKTEDMELAMRMQSNNLKIANAHNAVIYTTAPKTFAKLYTQRVRWTYGFIKNTSDYRFMMFKRKYGNLGVFILPLASLSILATLYTASTMFIQSISQFIEQIVKIQTVGFHLPHLTFNFDWFFISTNLLFLSEMAAFMGMVVILLLSHKIARGGYKRLGVDLVYFLAIYTIIAPVWLAKAVYNALFSVTTSWR